MSSVRVGLVAIVALLLVGPPDARARTIRVDRSVGFIPGATLANDGHVELQLLAGPSDARVPFSINFFGATYDRFFLNENGVISFGSPLSAPPSSLADVFGAGVPVIVPYFADADLSNGGAAFLNTTVGTNLFVSAGSTYQGATGDSVTFNQWQVAFFGSEGSTDFTLELNYDNVRWESGNLDGGVDGLGGTPPRVGFSDGSGRTYEVPGSGINGALLGVVIGQSCPAGSLSVACNDYDFQFIDGLPYRNGVPIFPVVSPVPEPASVPLMLTGLALLVALRRRSFAPR